MNRKKIGAVLISLCVTVSLMTSAALGAETDSKSLEDAILNVKSIVSISDDYSNFSYSSDEVDNGENKVNVWNLNWTSDDEKLGEINAEIDSYGNLISYDKYQNDESTSGLAKVNIEEAEASAEEFLKKVMPDYVKDMRMVEKSADSYKGGYCFTYQQYVNDIPVTFFKVSISISKETGEVQYYYGVKPGTQKLEYPKTDGIIDADNAKNRYVEGIQDDLSYYSVYDYKNKNIKTYPAYVMYNNKAIDALTGNVIDVDNSESNIYNDRKETLTGDSADGSGLSKIEKKAVDNISGLISKEKARQILNENYDLLAKMDEGNVSLYQDTINNFYVWSFDFTGGSAEVNADTGEILGFNIQRNALDNNDNDESNVITEEQARAKAEEFLKKTAESKFSQTKASDSNSGKYVYRFEYKRQANGKDCNGNELSVTVDKKTGSVMSYSNRWFDNASFADISNAISKSGAFDKFNESKNFGLNYVITEDNKIALAYGFYKEPISYRIDALSGKKIDYMGNDYNEYKEDKIPEYQDIKGHWCEKTVKKLIDNGYYIARDNFNPDKNISQINFFRYMLSSEMNGYSDDDLYNFLINKGIISKEEKDPSKTVTNKEAAEFITKYLGYGKIADLSEIFSNKFNDSIDDKYLGYASICYGLNIIKGDSKGNFNENQNITNATAAVYIYNMLSGDNKNYSDNDNYSDDIIID
ncbi:MAG: PepSY domain-containing protein [Clostridium sp.]